MAHFAVTAIGADRPGIVAGVTGALRDVGCNLEDSTMSILRGHFAILLVLDAPETESGSDLEQSLAGVADALDLVVSVRPIADDVTQSSGGDTWTLAVYGADKPGIVHEITKLLAADGVNILDLSTSVIGDPDRPVYALMLDIDLPVSANAADLSARLEALGEEIGVDTSMHAVEADIL